MTAVPQIGRVGEVPLTDSRPKPRRARLDGSIPRAVVMQAPHQDAISTSGNGDGGGMQDTVLVGVTDAARSSSQRTARRSPTRAPGVVHKKCAKCLVEKPQSAFRSVRARKCEACRSTEPRRSCSACEQEKPESEFRWHGRDRNLCLDCAPVPAPTSSAHQPRVCLRCWELKEASDFSYRKKGKHKRRRGVCRKCRKQEANKKYRARLAKERRVRWVDEHGVSMRRCSVCNEPKREQEEYYTERRDHGLVRYSARCKKCSLARWKEYQERVAATPGAAEELRRKRREWQKDWRARNPERYHENNRLWARKQSADPVKRAERLENERLLRAMRRQEKGLPPLKQPAIVQGHEYLPSWPVVELLDRMLESEGGPFETNDDATVTAVCERAGVSMRALSRWRNETESVRFVTADTVCISLGLLWWEIWKAPEEERRGTDRPHAVLAWIDRVWKVDDAYLAARNLFEGGDDG